MSEATGAWTIPFAEDCILERLLTDLHAFRPHDVDDHRDIVRGWLTSTSAGTDLRRWCVDEAAVLDRAADWLATYDDVDLQRIGRALAGSAARLRQLACVPPETA